MSVVVSQPHINDFWLEGTISQSFLDLLQEKFGDDFRIEKMDEDEDWENVEECDWYQEALEHDNPQENLRFYRELAGLTQRQLGDMVGVSSRFISDMEHGRRAISKNMAKSLSKALSVPPDRFLQDDEALTESREENWEFPSLPPSGISRNRGGNAFGKKPRRENRKGRPSCSPHSLLTFL